MWCGAGVASDAASAAGDTTRPTELGRRPNSRRGTYLSRQYYRYVLFIPVVEVRTCHASITGMSCSYQS